MSHSRIAAGFILLTLTLSAAQAIALPPVTIIPPRLCDVSDIPTVRTEPANWNGKVVIFVHGLGESKEVWLSDMQRFADEGYVAIAFDLPLHGAGGGSPSLEDIPEIVDDGASRLSRLAFYAKFCEGASEVYVVARSLGSVVAAAALGDGADVDKAELLLATANLRYAFEYGAVGSSSPRPSWLGDDAVIREIDPMYTLPGYEGSIHFHCGLRDDVLPPETCALAYNSAILARERRIYWHDVGHSMPSSDYIDEALAFFSRPALISAGSMVKSLGVSLPPWHGDGKCGLFESWENSPFDCRRRVLIVAFQLHIEESPGGGQKYDENETLFNEYADVLEALAEVFERHGAKLSIQTEKNFARADVLFGRGILAELESRGHGVGVQSHMAHHADELGLVTDDDRLDYTLGVKAAVERAIGREPTNIGGGFELDEACRLGICQPGLNFTSMTAAEKPYFRATRRPPIWLHPWIIGRVSMRDLSSLDWQLHDYCGGIVYIPGWYMSDGEFEVECAGNPSCFDPVRESFRAALSAVDDRFINVWWFSSHLYQTRGRTDGETQAILQRYDAWLTYLEQYADDGEIVWMTFDEIEDLFIKWEAERLAYIYGHRSPVLTGP